MVRHNNIIPGEHFRKQWDVRVKTWLHQPLQKKIRREKRRLKAASIAPRPTAGSLRPLVHAPTQKYNSKLRFGRGFTLEELKVAGITAQFAKTVGIAVDHRRSNKCTESLTLNVERLKNYKERLVVFPRRAGKPKKGDASAEDIANVRQLKDAIVAAPAKQPAVTFTQLSDEAKQFNGRATIRNAMNDAKLVGIRAKKAKEAKAADPKDE